MAISPKSRESARRPWLDSLSNALPYIPASRTAIECVTHQGTPAIVSGLTHILFLPSHNQVTTHLPVYSYQLQYREAVNATGFGSIDFKIALMFMRRPRGDGMNESVEWYLNTKLDDSGAILSKRSLGHDPVDHVEITSISLPAPGNIFWVSVPGTENRRVAVDTCRKEATATFGSTAQDKLWKLKFDDTNQLCLQLWESIVGGTKQENPPALVATYHHAGAQRSLPVKFSEGILLLRPGSDGATDGIIIAVFWEFLRRIREVQKPGKRAILLNRLLRS